MSKQVLTFGTLLEVVEDWVRKGSLDSRIRIRVVDENEAIEVAVGGAYFVPHDRKILLVAKTPNQEDLFDDGGNLLNDESPNGIHRNLQEIENQGIDYGTPVGIEIWFENGSGDEIQYRLESESYSTNPNFLIVEHFLSGEKHEHDVEFRQLLNNQYKVL